MTASLPRVVAAVITACVLTGSALGQTTKVQFVHASPDIQVLEVDLYVDGELYIDDFRYTKATPPVDVPVGLIDFAIAPSSSQSVADAIASFSKDIGGGSHYWAVLHGVSTPEEFPVNPEGRDTDLDMAFRARPTTPIPYGDFRVRMFNAMVDSRRLDFWLDRTGNDYQVRNSVGYGAFSQLNQQAVGSYKGYVTPDTRAWPRLIDLERIDFSPYKGMSILEIPIGLFEPYSSFRFNAQWLWVLDDGTTLLQPIHSRPAEVQFIAAAPEEDFGAVDLWVDGFMVAENIEYLRCTPAIALTAGLPIELAITPTGVTSPDYALYRQQVNFESSKAHHAILAGVTDPGLYVANPAGEDISMKVFIDSDAQSRASNRRTAIRSFHSRIDLGAVDFYAFEDMSHQSFDDLTFGHFSDYEYPGTLSAWGTLTMGDDITYELSRGLANFGELNGESLVQVIVDGASSPFQSEVMIYSMNGAEYSRVLTDTEDGVVPEDYVLHGNYPNPFNPSTKIEFELPASVHVTLAIHDVLGRRVATLVDGMLAAGRHSTTWAPASDVPSGVYFYSLTTPAGRQTRALTLLQ